MTDAAHTDRLGELLALKHQLLVQLERLVVRQAELAGGDDWSALVKLLSAKHRVLTALRDTETALDVFRNDDPDSRAWRSPEARAAATSLVGQSAELLTRVMKMEKDAEQQLIERRNATAARLDELGRSSEARGAYAPKLPTAMSTLNVVSER
jgi:hypothetical protein